MNGATSKATDESKPTGRTVRSAIEGGEVVVFPPGVGDVPATDADERMADSVFDSPPDEKGGGSARSNPKVTMLVMKKAISPRLLMA